MVFGDAFVRQLDHIGSCVDYRVNWIFKSGSVGVGEMAEWLRALATLVDDLGLILTPSTHMAANKHLEYKFQGMQHPLLISKVRCTSIHEGITHNIKIIKIYKKVCLSLRGHIL